MGEPDYKAMYTEMKAATDTERNRLRQELMGLRNENLAITGKLLLTQVNTTGWLGRLMRYFDEHTPNVGQSIHDKFYDLIETYIEKNEMIYNTPTAEFLEEDVDTDSDDSEKDDESEDEEAEVTSQPLSGI